MNDAVVPLTATASKILQGRSHFVNVELVRHFADGWKQFGPMVAVGDDVAVNVIQLDPRVNKMIDLSIDATNMQLRGM